MDNKEDDKRLIITISFNETNGTYEVKLPQGSNLAEAAFGIAAFIKCLVRDKIIKEPSEFIEQIQKAEGVGISMLPKPSALAISSPEGILLPDSDLITECDNTNVFVVLI